MDCGTVAKISRKRRKNDTDNTPQQEKIPVYFSNDTILEAVKFLNYENWSQMRFLCHRVNQLIQSNQSTLQAFEVKSLSMSAYPTMGCTGTSIVSFDQGIQPVNAVRKWFQDRGYSCDETTDMPLEKVFAGLKQFTFQAFFEKPTEKNMVTRGQAKRMGKARKKGRRLSNALAVQVFGAKLNGEYGLILSHFLRLLYHPAAYFREIVMLPLMTDKFCDMASKNLIRCEQFTLHLDSSPEYSLKWLKDNVRAQQITFSFTYYHTFIKSDLRMLVAEFFLQDASICAQDRIKLDLIPKPEEFVNTLVKKYETLKVTKTIPTIVLEFNFSWHQTIKSFFESNLVPQYYPPFYDKYCDDYNIKTYELQNKLDGSRKMIAQYWYRYSNYTVYVRFE